VAPADTTVNWGNRERLGDVGPEFELAAAFFGKDSNRMRVTLFSRTGEVDCLVESSSDNDRLDQADCTP
jgi:DNA phosphorothioation-dependent restriction protein DptG